MRVGQGLSACQFTGLSAPWLGETEGNCGLTVPSTGRLDSLPYTCAARFGVRGLVTAFAAWPACRPGRAALQRLVEKSRVSDYAGDQSPAESGDKSPHSIACCVLISVLLVIVITETEGLRLR